MLLAEREQTILALVNQNGVVSVRELAVVCDVTEVTIRRDLNKLEQDGLLQRTHGGAIRIDNAPQQPTTLDPDCDYVSPVDIDNIPDALILAPTQHSTAHTLREHALRNSIPLLAESSHFPGSVYLGPKNYKAAFQLGRWTGEYIQNHLSSSVHVLDISHAALPNTQRRSQGFADGMRNVLGDDIHILTVDGRGLYNEAYQVAFDALHIAPEINVIFGINDDSVLAGLQAYQDLRRDPDRLVAVNVGGEGRTLFDRLHRGGPLKACMALFPEIVGRMGIEAILHLWNGEDIGAEVITPSMLLTADNLTQFYTPHQASWQINLTAIEQLTFTRWAQPPPPDNKRRLSFVIHYCTHEWYQNVAEAMQNHAAHYGLDLSIVDMTDNLAVEIRELRRLIGKVAAKYVQDGDTIILDTGTPTTYMAQFLQGFRDLTVITNSLAVLQILQNVPEINVTLTGGEFHRESQSFVGRGGQLLLQEIRADKTFIVAGGVSSTFGISSENLPEAEMRRAMIAATREVVVLADHTVLGVDAHVRVTDLNQANTLITDAGALSEHRLDLHQRGIKVLVAGQYNEVKHQDQPA